MTKLTLDAYDRSRVTPGIVHFGVGGFHRAHQAMYIDELLRQGEALDWGIVGVGTMPGDVRMRDALHSQGHLYTLAVKSPDGSLTPRTIGSIIDYLFAPDDPEAVLVRLTSPAIRIVSLTVLSCDNLPGNGDIARRMLCAFAACLDSDLADWIDTDVDFPNCMVDRITPATTDDDVTALRRDHAITDAWPVVCEPWVQWVLEDRFGHGRPPLELVGVQLVDDVAPYELMKLRLLNASHQAMCYLGTLAGHAYAHEVAADPLFAGFLLGYMEEEASPTLLPVPGVDLHECRHSLLDRFASPAVKDPLARLCAETSDRIPKFLLPVIHDNLATSGGIDRAALVVAAWARYAEGVDEHGQPIEVIDPLRDRLMAAAALHDRDLTAFLRDRELFGDLIDDARFVESYTASLATLRADGARAAIARLTALPTPMDGTDVNG